MLWSPINCTLSTGLCSRMILQARQEHQRMIGLMGQRNRLRSPYVCERPNGSYPHCRGFINSFPRSFGRDSVAHCCCATTTTTTTTFESQNLIHALSLFLSRLFTFGQGPCHGGPQGCHRPAADARSGAEGFSSFLLQAWGYTPSPSLKTSDSGLRLGHRFHGQARAVFVCYCAAT